MLERVRLSSLSLLAEKFGGAMTTQRLQARVQVD